MEAVRVKLEVRYNVPPPTFVAEFDGKVGTLVWVTKSAWGGLQVSVELDEPHSIFGEFCNIAYMNTDLRQNEVIAVPLDGEMDTAYKLAEIQDGNWNKFRAKDGSPLSWSTIEKEVNDAN